MSKNDWTNKLRDQLADYQEPVSPDLWAGIESSLAHLEQSQQSHNGQSHNGQSHNGQSHNGQPHIEQSADSHTPSARFISLKRWSAAAAAIALLGVGGGYVYLQHEPATLPLASDVSMRRTSDGDSTDSKSVSNSKDNLNFLADAHVQSSRMSTGKLQKPASLSSQEAIEPINPTMPSIETASVGETGLSSEEPASPDEIASLSETEAASNTGSPSKAEIARKTEIASNTEVSMARLEEAFGRKPSHHGDLALNLYAENFISSAPSGVLDGAIYASDCPASGKNYMSQAPSWSEMASSLMVMKASPYKEGRHHAPLSVGIQMGWGIAPRTSVSTGVVYTRTSSDFKMSAFSGYTVHQVLHYVGVPLSVNYEMLSLGDFKAYVMAGGEADFNVKNDTKDQDVKVEDAKKDRPQFSAKTSLGLQYDLVPQVGLYLEPGARYYFDNGSDIENTFKNKKWNFNLQLGLRINLGK